MKFMIDNSAEYGLFQRWGCHHCVSNHDIIHDMVLFSVAQAHSADFENSSWYEALMFYSFTEDGSVVRNDQDVKLVPSVIDKVLIPKVTGEKQMKQNAATETIQSRR